MISPETRAAIRRYFYAEHWKIGTIARELGVHPDTIRNAIESERFQSTQPLRALASAEPRAIPATPHVSRRASASRLGALRPRNGGPRPARLILLRGDVVLFQ